jgi:hypothetical protein
MPIDPANILEGFDVHIGFWAKTTLPDGRVVFVNKCASSQEALEALLLEVD